MPAIFLDARPQHFGSPPETWGDLLASLDAQAAADGVILTVARFDGVEEPSFREPAVTTRALDGIGRVDVATAAPTAFLRECLVDASQWLERSAELAQRLGQLYRSDNVSRGPEGLVALAGDLRSLALLVKMLEGSMGIDLATIERAGVTAAQELGALGTTVDALVDAQQAEDWATVADILEDDLEPALRRWVTLIGVIVQRLE